MSWYGNLGSSLSGYGSRLGGYLRGGERGYLQSLGQGDIPEDVQIEGPSATFAGNPSDATSGGGQFMTTSSNLQGLLGKTSGGKGDKVGDALFAPEREQRAALADLIPRTANIGEGIQPVPSSPGGAAMVGAMRQERRGRQQSEAGADIGELARQLRDLAASGLVAENATAIIKQLVSYGAGGMGGGGGGMAGGMGGGAGGYAGLAASFMNR